MAGEFLESLGKLTVFVICAQMLVYFRPKRVYEKYLRLLMNLLILMQLLLPIGNFLRGGTELDLRAQYEAFQRRVEEYMEGTALRTYDRWGTEEGGKVQQKAEQDAPGPEVCIEAIERVEIPAVELGGKDEQ